jgi:hypothetical protein
MFDFFFEILVTNRLPTKEIPDAKNQKFKFKMGQKKLSGKTIYHACSSNTVNRIYRPVTKFLHATNCIYIKDHLSRRKIEQHLAMHTTIGSLRKILHTNHVIIAHCMSSLDRQQVMKRAIALWRAKPNSRNGTRRVAPEFVAPVLSCVPLLYYSGWQWVPDTR